MDLKEALWQRGKYMEYLDEISVYKSVKNDRAKEQIDMKAKMQELSEICYDIGVDMGYSSQEETMVTISMPYSNLRYLSVTNKNEEEKNNTMPTGHYVDYIGVDMNELMKKNKEIINMGSMGISWKDTFSKEEKKMSGLMACDEICEYLGIQIQSRTPTPNNKPKWIERLPAVEKVETYNNRVVKVTFIDGTYTKAVCSENDNFDLDMGITICAMKRMLGTNSENATKHYNQFIDHVHSVMEKNTLKELAEEAKKAKEKNKQRKAELKRAAKKLKAREEQIDIQKQAFIRAQKELEAEDQ